MQRIIYGINCRLPYFFLLFSAEEGLFINNLYQGGVSQLLCDGAERLNDDIFAFSKTAQDLNVYIILDTCLHIAGKGIGSV